MIICMHQCSISLVSTIDRIEKRKGEPCCNLNILRIQTINRSRHPLLGLLKVRNYFKATDAGSNAHQFLSCVSVYSWRLGDISSRCRLHLIQLHLIQWIRIFRARRSQVRFFPCSPIPNGMGPQRNRLKKYLKNIGLKKSSRRRRLNEMAKRLNFSDEFKEWHRCHSPATLGTVWISRPPKRHWRSTTLRCPFKPAIKLPF